MKIKVERLNSGQFVARPENGLGTCGWYPFAWTACFAKTSDKAARMFEQNHAKQIRELNQ